MNKINLKRAILTITHCDDNFYPETKLISNINLYKDSIKTEKRGSADFKFYQLEIQRMRNMLKKFRKQNYIFEVYVKQYKATTSIDYRFENINDFNKNKENYRKMLKEVVNMAISKIRKELKLKQSFSKFGKYNLYFYGQKKQGRVFTKKNEILQLYIQKNVKNLYKEKLPIKPKKYIGIEIEFCAPIDEHDFALKLFKNGIHKFAQLKKDGSLRPEEGEEGYELAILLEERNYKKNLKLITNLLNEVKAVTKDRRAGLHVHLDMRKRDKDLVYSNLVACQYALLSIVDPKRFNNEFCKVVKSRKFPTEFTGERQERYKTINAAAFYKYKTLEVRMHEGSIDYNQISNWVDLLISIAKYDQKIKNKVSKVSSLQKKINLNKKVYSYIQDRSCYWQINNSENNRFSTAAPAPENRNILEVEIEGSSPISLSNALRVTNSVLGVS